MLEDIQAELLDELQGDSLNILCNDDASNEDLRNAILLLNDHYKTLINANKVMNLKLVTGVLKEIKNKNEEIEKLRKRNESKFDKTMRYVVTFFILIVSLFLVFFITALIDSNALDKAVDKTVSIIETVGKHADNVKKFRSGE